MNAPVAAETLAAVCRLAEPLSAIAPTTTHMVVSLLRSSLRTLTTDREMATAYIEKACAALEAAAAIAVAQEGATPELARGGLASWQTQRVKAYIDANLDDQVNVPRLAALVRLGASHFRRAFKKSFGVNPHAYLMERRVRRAQELLLMTDEPLSAIALTVGFADQAHLTKRFHRLVGTTPSAWRRAAGGGEVMGDARAAA